MKSLVESITESLDSNFFAKVAQKIAKESGLKNVKAVLKAVDSWDNKIQDIKQDYKVRVDVDDQLPSSYTIDGKVLIMTDRNGTDWVWDPFDEEWTEKKKQHI